LRGTLPQFAGQFAGHVPGDLSRLMNSGFSDARYAIIATSVALCFWSKAVTYRSDTSDGPTAGTETADPLEFLARVLVQVIGPFDGTVCTYDN